MKGLSFGGYNRILIISKASTRLYFYAKNLKIELKE